MAFGSSCSRRGRPIRKLAGLAQLKRTSEEAGRHATYFNDWRVFEARIFGGGHSSWVYQVDA